MRRSRVPTFQSALLWAFVLGPAAAVAGQAAPKDVPLEWEEWSGTTIVVPETAEHAVMVVAAKDQRNDLLKAIDANIKLPQDKDKKTAAAPADLVKKAKLYLLDPAVKEQPVTKVYNVTKPPVTLFVSRRGVLIHRIDGMPSAAKPEEFLAALAELRNIAEERRKELTKDIADLASAMTGAKGPAADLIRTMQAEVKAADFDSLASMSEACERLTMDQALEAVEKAKLLALGNQKKEALAKVEAIAKTFKKVPDALKVLDETRAEIEADKVGTILGEWWHGGAIGAAYYTGKGAQYLKAFESLGTKVAPEMGLPYLEIHVEDVLGGDNDKNGCLLYPDGAARVRLMIMPGGNAHTTFLELGGVNGQAYCKGREFFKDAFKSGMNYIGSCGGCFSASSGSGLGVPNAFNSNLSLWPGELSLKDTGRKPPDPDIVLSPFHPLARGLKDGVLKQVFFNGGPTAMTPNVPGTEYVGFFRGGGLEALHGKAALIAYTPAGHKGGRLVVCAAHPETKYPAFLEGMADYAWQHRYALPRNPVKPGEPVKGCCGDNQCQYYEVKVEEGAKSLEVVLSELDGDCDLYMRFAGYPTLTMQPGRQQPVARPTKKDEKPPPPVIQPGVWTADKRSTTRGNKEEKISVPNPKAGVWFIAVHGNHQVLNGANYTITAKAQ